MSEQFETIAQQWLAQAQAKQATGTGTGSGALTLPTPYPLQQEILDHPAKYKVAACGRRFGKTVMAARKSVQLLMDGKRVLLSSATQDQSDVFWRYVRKWTMNIPDVYKNESRRILQFGGGELRVKTGREPDVLKGDFYDFAVLDECALLDPRAWYEVVLPMLLDTEGDAMFLSTPRRRNWFWQLYMNALSDTTGRWAAWNAPTHANPYLKAAAIEQLAAEMTDEMYQQEILAQFLEGQGAVFRRIDECATAQPGTPQAGHTYVMGVDWAQSVDFTALVVMDRDTRQMVALDRFNGVDWSLQRGRIRTLYDLWKPVRIIAESNSIGSPNIEALRSESLPVRSFQTTAQTKPPLIESLVLAFERGEITVLDNPILKGELMAYERVVSSTGRSQYSAPSGMHDDTVIALALAWYGIQSGTIAMPILLD